MSIDSLGSPLDQVLNQRAHGMTAETVELESYSWFQKGLPFGEPKELDASLFAKICAGSFIKNTPYEGGHFFESGSYFVDFLERVQKTNQLNFSPLQLKRIQETKERIEGMIAIDQQIYGILENEDDKNGSDSVIEDTKKAKRMAQLANTFCKQFKEKGELWFPGGWQNVGGSHFLVLHITQNGKLEIINTGAGLGYHPKVIETSVDPITQTFKEVVKFDHVVEVSCDPNELAHPHFFRTLIEMKILHCIKAEIEVEASHFYKGLINHAGGNIKKKSPLPKSSSLFKKAQRSGNCTVKALSSFLCHSLTGRFDENRVGIDETGIDLFKQLKFLMQMEALVAFVGNVHTPKEIRLIKDVSANLARAAEKWERRGGLTDTMRQGIVATLKEVEQKVAPLSPAPSKSENKPITIKINPEGKKEPIELPPPGEYPPPEKIDSHVIPQSLASNIHQQEDLQTFSIILSDESFKNPQKIKRELNKLFFSIQLHQDFKNRCSWAPELILSLPIPEGQTNDDPFWSKIPEADRHSCIESLESMISTLCMKEQNSNPVDTIIFYALLTMIDYLARLDKDSQLEGFQLCYLDLLFQLKAPHCGLIHPSHQRMLKKVMLYFDPTYRFDNQREPLTREQVEEQAGRLFSLFRFENETLYWGKQEISKETIEKDQTMSYYHTLLKRGGESLRNKIKEKLRSQPLPSNGYKTDLIALMAFYDDFLPDSVKCLRKATILVTIRAFTKYGFLILRPCIEVSKQANPRKVCLKYSQEKKVEWRLDKNGNSPINLDIPQGKIHPNPEILQNLVFLSESKIKLVSPQFQTHREQALWQMAVCDPFDEVNCALKLAKQNPQALTDAHIRSEFSHRFFRPERLLSQMEDCSHFTQIMQDFFDTMFAHFLRKEDFEVLSFMITLELQVSLTIPLNDRFPWLWKKLFSSLTLYQPETMEICQSLLDGLTDYQFKDVLRLKERSGSWAMILGIYRLAANVNHAEIDSNATLLEQKLADRLEKSWDQVGLNQLVNWIYPDVQGAKWEGSYPQFTAGVHSIDLHDGTCRIEGHGEISGLPHRVKDDENFEKVMSAPVKTCEQVGKEHYHLNRGLETELIVYSPESLEGNQYYRHFQKQLYQWVNENSFKDAILSKENLFLPVEWEELLDCQLWSKVNDTEVLVTLNEQPHYKINNELFIRLSDNYQLIRGSGLKYSYKLNFGSMQASCQCWGWHLGDHLKEFSARSLNLDFQVEKADGVHRLYVKQYPGYFLVEPFGSFESNATGPLLGEVCLFLSNSQNTKVLISKECKHIKEIRNMKLSSKASYGMLIIQKSLSGCQWYEFSLQEGMLHSERTEEQLMLGLLYARDHNYQAAHLTWNRCQPLKRFSWEELDLIEQCMEELWKDHHPAARALLLKLVFKNHENWLKYRKGVEDEPLVISAKNSADVYAEYQVNKMNAPDCLLSAEEERQLCQLLHTHFPKDEKWTFNERYQGTFGYLKSGIGSQSRRVCPVSIKEKVFKYPSVESLVQAFDQRSEFILSHPFLLCTPELFETHFFTFYRLWRSVNEENRKHLKTQFSINRVNDSNLYLNLLVGISNGKGANYRSLQQLESIKAKSKSDFERAISRIIPIYETRIELSLEARVLQKYNSVIRWLQQIDPPKTLSRRVKRFTQKKVVSDQTDLHQLDKDYDQFFQNLHQTYFEESSEATSSSHPQLPVDQHTGNLNRILQREQTDHEYYLKQERLKKHYQWREEKTPEDLKKQLKNRVDELKEQLVQVKSALVWDRHAHGGREWWVELGYAQRVDFEQLRKLASNETVQPQQAALMACYLVHATRLQQMEEAFNYLEKMNGQSDSHILGKVSEVLRQKRGYQHSSMSIARLSFEYANKIRYRKEQIDKWEAIVPQGAPVLAEMPTGFGKTKMAAPITFQLMQSGKKVVNVWPSSIEMINSIDLRNHMEKSFGQPVDRLFFDRSTPINLDLLQRIWDEVQKPTPLNIRSETLRALELHFILLLDIRSKKVFYNNEIANELELLWKILRYLRQNGVALIDEAHQTLDPHDKLIYTLGSPAILPVDELDFFDQLFRFLLVNDPFRITKNQQGQVSQEEYFTVARSIANHFCNQWKIKNKKECIDYLFGSVEILKWVEAHPKKELICLLKGVLSLILEVSIKGAVDEDFGPSKIHLDTKEFAISYLRANTPKETEQSPSQFKNPHETFVKTYITYLHKGLRKRQVVKLIEHLQKVISEHRQCSVKELREYCLLEQLLPNLKNKEKKLSEEQIEPNFDKIRKDQEAIFYYVREFVAKQVRVYPQVLVSTPQNFLSQFQNSLSMTATPPHHLAHRIGTDYVPMKGTSGEVTHLLLTKGEIHFSHAEQSQEILEECIQLCRKDSKKRVLTDVGAQFKGVSSHDVAKQLCNAYKENSDVEAVLYYDEESERFQLMTKETGDIHDPIDVDLSAKQRVTYFDQSRSVGSDMTQAMQSVALVTVGHRTTKKGFGQGAGRMRGWAYGQGNDIVLSSSLHKKETSKMDLLLFFLQNQVREEEPKNYEAIRMQMENEVRTAAMDLMLNMHEKDENDFNLYSLIGDFRKVKKVFIQEESYTPSQIYRNLSTAVPTKDVLKEHHQSCLKALDPFPVRLFELESKHKNRAKERLNKYPQVWQKEEILLPETVNSANSLGVQCEVLQEVEAEVNTQVQAEENATVRGVWVWPEKLEIFKPGWEQPWKLNSFFYRAAAVIRQIGLIIYKVIKINLAVAFIVYPLAGYYLSLPELIATGIIAGALLVSVVGIEKLKSYWKADKEEPVKKKIEKKKGYAIWRLSDVMVKQLSGTVGQKLFDSRLLVSNNFLVQEPVTPYEVSQVPFTYEQKPLFQLLVIHDGKDKIQAMLVDQHDSQYFRGKFKEDHASKEPIQGRKRKLALYDLKHGIVAQGKNQFEKDELEKNTIFQKLLAEAKFFNGEMSYSAEEKVHLDQRADAVGAGEMNRFFSERIRFLHVCPVDIKFGS